MDDWLDDDDEDDELLDTLSKKPPRELGSLYPQAPPSQNDGTAQLLKAQGEASMLRDRIKIIEKEKDQERKLLLQKSKELEQKHQQELESLKAELQRAEDEKKFLAYAGKSHLKSSSSANATVVPQSSSPSSHEGVNSSDAASKKRRVVDTTKPMVVIKPNRILTDESGLFIQSVISHQLKGSEMSTLEILHHIRLAEVQDFEFRDFKICNGDPVGKGIFELLMSRQRSSFKLDQFIESWLESLAVLIKDISEHSKECKTAVPFLVALMHHSITFRPSAVRPAALKDLFHFMVDLIRTNRGVLKKPLAKSPLHLDVGPNIFQYEFIRILIVLYAFDTLEDSLKTLQSLSSQCQVAFMDEPFCEAINDLSRYSLTISYQPVLNVVYSTMEIFNCMANMLLDSPQLAQRIPHTWWENVKNRFYQVLTKTVSNNEVRENDCNSLFLPDETNIYGLIRNLGNNYNGRFISQLVSRNEPLSVPQVILKEFPESELITHKSVDVEWWSLKLKIGIVQLFGKLATVYRSDPVEKGMIKVLARLMAQTQETLLTVLLGQESENIHMYYSLFSELLKLIFHIWHDRGCDLGLISEVECELTVCLWRIVFGTDAENDTHINRMEMIEHKVLVDQFDELRLQSDLELFEDAFDGEHVDFVKEEMQSVSFGRCREIMGVGVDMGIMEMAKKMLECITSMEDADVLYLAMRGNDVSVKDGM
ncbi:LAME_0G01772g1_1 [Lachancea meyersii CBS 8951]|uniref:LAME_0G01772g1_1 n=1 Tax=Lachancea meyersii CBS 8951 TaxID=1266667 RepID=A0A1G4K5L2_9SACH|nr:LAME_0G01772g1_1 [Lachancea meyersii CBS 8951]